MKPLQYLVIFGVALAMYANTLGHGYVLDDKAIITQNTFTQQGFAGIADHFTHSYWFGINGKDAGNYRPISGVSFSIEHALFGNSPFIGHLLNVLCFALLCVVLLRWLTRLKLMDDVWLYLAMLLFVAHPIHTEVVANIKSRDEIYCLLFFALSANQFWTWLEDKKPMSMLGAAILFLVALLSKETALALLPVYMLMAYKKSERIPETIKLSITPIAVSAIFLAIYFSVTEVLLDQQYHVFDNALTQPGSASDVLATKIWIMGEYLRLLFIPHPLVYDYSFNTIPLVSFSNSQVLLTLGALIALIGWRIRQFKNRGVKSEQHHTFILALLILPIIPVSNFLFPIGATMAERFLFIPSLGFVLLAVSGISMILNKLALTKKIHAQVVMVLIIVPMALVTFSRNGDWKSDETLFTHDLQHLNQSAKAHHNLANIYKAKAEKLGPGAKRVTYYESAATLMEQALSIYEVQEFHHELGLIYGELGKWEGVKKSLGRYVEMNPTDATAWMQIGIAHGISQEMDEAVLAFERAYEIDPSDAEITLNLAKTYAMTNQSIEAKTLTRQGLKIHPKNKGLLELDAQLN